MEVFISDTELHRVGTERHRVFWLTKACVLTDFICYTEYHGEGTEEQGVFGTQSFTEEAQRNTEFFLVHQEAVSNLSIKNRDS